MIFKSPLPAVSLPEVPFTPLLLERTARWADRTALIDGSTGQTLTFGEWAKGVRRGAAGLAARGFGKGDVLAIFSTNLPEYATAFHAVSLAGGATTTINPTYTADELAAQLKDARARYLVTIPPFLDKALGAARAAGVQETFVFGQAQGARPFADLLDAEGDPPAVDLRPREDLAALPYSSGTTGLPKGVMLTHHNLVSNLLQMAACLSLGERDTLVAVLPFFHIYGLMVIMNLGLYVGAPVVTLPRFDLEGFLQVLARHRVTFAQVVPPIALALAKHPSVAGHDLSSLRAVFSGAAPLGEAVTRACGERLGCMVMQGYGLTETSPGALVSPNDPARLKAGSVGQVIPNTECQVVDVERGVPVGPGERGEVWIRGPQVMKGYLGRPEATAAMIDADGWLHSGDIGYADADGHFFIVDRVKELIKYKGLQIAPAELEAVLLAHSGVADAAVIGVPDEEAGEVPKAFLVLKGGADPQEVLEFVAGRVAPYKKVRHVQVVDADPQVAVGQDPPPGPGGEGARGDAPGRVISGPRPALDRWFERVFGDDEPARLGTGWLSGVAGTFLGALALGGVLVLLFPGWLSTPRFRTAYPLGLLRAGIQVLIVLAFVCGCLSLWLRRRKVLGLTACALAVAAALLGGGAVPVDGPLDRPVTFGLDWFLLNLFLFALLFAPLERLFPLRREQGAFRTGWTTDSLHFLASHGLVQVLSFLILLPAVTVASVWQPARLQALVQAQPVWVQFLEVLVAADLAQYAVHRAFHRVPLLWRFHSVHHSSRDLDWLAGSRLHLVDAVATRGLVLLPLSLLGFAQPALHAYLVFVSFHAVLIHANVHMRLRPLEDLVVTPRFHHWHHAAAAEARDRNFAVHLPWLDRLFGSRYLPADGWPSVYGIAGDPVPEGYLAQLTYPLVAGRRADVDTPAA